MMAAGLCSDWRAAAEGLTAMVSNAMFDVVTFHGLQPAPPTLPAPLGLLDCSSPPSFDANLLDQYYIAFDVGGGPLLAAQDPFGVDLFSCHPGESAAHYPYSGQYSYGTPSNAIISGGDRFGAGGLIRGRPSVDVAAATPLQTSATVAAAAMASVGSTGGCNAGGCPSPHSMAARQRRRRISEKTLELGRLIPGGGRMKAAEMLHSASKYVKFLQAQIGVLDMIGSPEYVGEEEEVRTLGASAGNSGQLLRVLLASPAVQEKLSAEGRCVVPTRLLHALAGDGRIRGTQSSVDSTDLSEFMASMR